MAKDRRDPATDDARSSDGKEADQRRDRLAKDAREGMQRALKSEPGPLSPKPNAPEKTPASSSLGTSAEGVIEDGESASAVELAKPPQRK